MRRWAIAGLLAAAGLWSEGARAEAKECVLRNNQGADEQSQHHLLAARDNYLACASAEECPAMVRSECEQALAELKASIPSLIVMVVDDHGDDLSEATLTLDGRPLAHDGTAIELDPGQHVVVAISPGRRAELSVMAAERELNRRVELVLHAPAVAAPAAPPPVAPPPERSHLPSYVVGGVGVLAAGSFAGFALSGHSGMSDLDRCKPYCQRDDVRAVQTKYLLADVSLGVSLVALGAAAYLWLRPAPTNERPPIALDVIAGPRMAAVSIGWSH
jgi:hypothetical protein